jgi:formylglycine-generating enzyme
MYKLIASNLYVIPLTLSLFIVCCTTANVDNNDSENSTRSLSHIAFNGDTSKQGMVYIAGGSFAMGADNEQAAEDEYPKHSVAVKSFWMDEHEVTNAQF